MIGLDTNVVVRFLAQDDAEQSAAANALLEGLSSASPGYLSLLVIAETNWVLRRAYGVERVAAGEIVRGLVTSSEIVVERLDLVMEALGRVNQGADVADALIHAVSRDAGCERTVTFDRGAVSSAGMSLLVTTSSPSCPAVRP